MEMSNKEIASWVAEFRQGARGGNHPLIVAIDALLAGDESRRQYVADGIKEVEDELETYLP